MISNILMAGILIFSGQELTKSSIWQKIEGTWSYIGKVQEKPQVLVWLEKNIKSKNQEIFTKEIKKMPFLTLSPKG